MNGGCSVLLSAMQPKDYMKDGVWLTPFFFFAILLDTLQHAMG